MTTTVDSAKRHRVTQCAVLEMVLQEFPARPTVDEVVLELNGGSADWSEKDEVWNAIRDLAGAGVLRIDGDGVQLTRPLRYYRQLADEGALD